MVNIIAALLLSFDSRRYVVQQSQSMIRFGQKTLARRPGPRRTLLVQSQINTVFAWICGMLQSGLDTTKSNK
jgi:hypothetical protein